MPPQPQRAPHRGGRVADARCEPACPGSPLAMPLHSFEGFLLSKTVEKRDRVVVRFAGDSGDGMQLTGSRFTDATAMVGNDLATLPDFPAEIRAPAGTPHGVSAFQIHFASRDILTPGDNATVLVAMNPAALITHVGALEKGGTLLINEDAFTDHNLKKAGYDSGPLEGDALGDYQVFRVL